MPPWVGTRPMRPSRNRMRALGAPIRQSQASTSAIPAPVTGPSIAATTGFSRRSKDSIEVGQAVRDVAVRPRVVELVEAVEVAAGAERAARAGQDDAADRGVAGGLGDGGGERVAQRRVDRVAPVGPVEREGEDAVGPLAQQPSVPGA